MAEERSSDKLARYILWAAAAAIIAYVLLFRPPQRVKDTFSDPTLAYIETMRAFSLFNDAVQDIK